MCPLTSPEQAKVRVLVSSDTERQFKEAVEGMQCEEAQRRQLKGDDQLVCYYQ